MTACNENGVYEAAEAIELPRHVKGWRGGPIGEIRLARLGTHWIWATGFQLWGGDCWGSSSPLMDTANRSAKSRAEALEQAGAHLRAKLSSRAAEYPDAAAILSWLETLAPDQLDLFGAAA